MELGRRELVVEVRATPAEVLAIHQLQFAVFELTTSEFPVLPLMVVFLPHVNGVVQRNGGGGSLVVANVVVLHARSRVVLEKTVVIASAETAMTA